MTDVTKLTIHQTLKHLNNKEFSAEELVQAHLDKMATTTSLNAYITPTVEQAKKQSRIADENYKNNQARPLEGIPLAIKDLFCTKDIRTTAASKILEHFIPPYSSTVTSRLDQAGSVTLGKTNMDEFAMGSANTTSYFGPVHNPWKETNNPDKILVPGGSSGGSAAAVASFSAMASLGSDTGGSIRQPASFCGLVGLKPTYGRVSRYGMIAFASSLDQAGPFTRCVEDAALILGVIAGADTRDSTCAQTAVPDYYHNLKPEIKGKKIGIPQEYQVEGLSQEITDYWQKTAKWLEEEGATLVPISLPHTQYALATYYIIAPAEASSNLARYDGVRFGLRVPGNTLDEQYMNTRGAGFGLEVKRRILIGTYALSSGYYDAYYIKAQKVRRLITQDFIHAFQEVDFILTPTTPSAAFGLGEKQDDPIIMYLNDVFTVPASLAGIPAISLPVGCLASNLPIGMQLLAPHFAEQDLLNASFVIQEKSQFDIKKLL